MLSLSQLSTPVTEEEALATLLQDLSDLGFSATSWQEGSVQRTLCQAFARKYAAATQWVAALALGLFNETATGDFLTHLSASVYANTRTPATAAQHQIRHTLAPSEGPHTITVGQLVATDGTLTFRNIAGGTLNAGTSPLTLLYEAEVPGADGNVATGTITTLQTTLSGVTITNPDTAPYQAGTDEESDEKLRVRNNTQWGLLAIDMPAAGYQNVVLDVPGVGRAKVDDSNPRGPGTVDIYIAAADGVAGAGDVTDAQTLIDTRHSVTADVLVMLAPSVAYNLVGTVYYRAAYTSAPTLIDEAVEAYVNTLPIQGVQLTQDLYGIPIDAVMAVIRAVPGVTNVDITSPGDGVLAPFNIAIANVSGLLKVPV